MSEALNSLFPIRLRSGQAVSFSRNERKFTLKRDESK